jgi:lipoyl(octanoyl) transferase
MALNVNVSLTPFQWIHPCGLQDVQITSMQRECGHTLSLHRVRAVLQQHFADLLARKPGRIEPDALAARIRAASG